MGECVQNSSGLSTHVLLSSAVLRDKEGRAQGAVAAAKDISELKAAEQALRESEERFRHMVQGVRDYAITMLDVEGRVATWNDPSEVARGIP